MADRLNRARRIVAAGLLGVLGACPLFAGAQGVLNDPTRPPAGVESGAAAVEASGPVLQSVLIPKKGKPVAVIGGQQVVLGGLYGESRLTKLSEREAVLEGPAGIERLLLTPGVEKSNIVTKKSAASESQNRGKP